MPIVKDKGNIVNQINGLIANVVVRLFGKSLNYKLRYFHHRHRWPDFENPKDLSEIVLSDMLRKDFIKYGYYADKVRVREYVKSKGLGNILLKQFATWQTADQINIENLPDKFIIKTNNGCGGHYICTDKSKIDIDFVKSLMKDKLDVTELSRTEPHYAAIAPLIFAEELMGDGINLPEDYKFYCINGKVDHVMVVCDRKDGGRKVITLNRDWHPLPYVAIEKMPVEIPHKPKQFEIMVDYAEKLSQDFKFVRVDLYDVNDKIYFGELTFSPNGGLFYSYTDDAIAEIGSHFK